MSTDPNMMAYMLQQGDAPPDMSGVDDFLGGVGKGLWKQYGQPVVDASKAAWNYAQDPVQGAQNLTQLLGALPAAGEGAIDRTADALSNPSSTAQAMLGALHKQFSTPEGAGEGVSYLMPGPGEWARGAEALGGADKLGIWGGPQALGYDYDKAVQAAEMQAQGKSAREIYQATADPHAGIEGYWNPPEGWGQETPWAWMSDKGVASPGLLQRNRAEMARQWEQRFDILDRAQMSGQFNGGPQDFARLRRDMASSGSFNSLNQETKQFLSVAAPEYARAPDRLSLGDVMPHDWSAFHNYPGLRDMELQLQPFSPAAGSFSPRRGNFTMGNVTGYSGPTSPATLLDTLMHEPSHAIQAFEGMPSGGAPKHYELWQRGLRTAQGEGNLSLTDMDLARDTSKRLSSIASEPLMGPQEGKLVSEPFRGYMSYAGEANARLPYQVQQYQRAGGARAEVPPFELYGLTGVNSDPNRLIPIGSGGRLYVPNAPASLHQYGVTNRMGPEPNFHVNLSAPASGPVDQLPLALRQARKRKVPGQ